MSQDSDSESFSEQRAERNISELQFVIGQQLENLRGTEERTMEIFRTNILLLSVIVSVLAYSFDSPSRIYDLLNYHLILGGLSLLLSTVVSVYTYAMLQFHMGATPSTIEETHEVEEWAYLRKLEQTYESLVDGNSMENAKTNYTLTFSLALDISAIVFSTVGIGIAYISGRGTALSYVLFIIEIVVVLVLTQGLFFSKEIMRSILEPQYRDSR